MGWSHPDISLPDLLFLVKGFVDIVVLASGRQSSGLPAHWDAPNVKKALQWGLFFEQVFRRISNSADYQESVKELDASLLELTSDPSFPQGLAHFSSATLMKARYFVVERLLNALPLRDAQLHALLSAVVELDFDDPRMSQESEPLVSYVNKLVSYETSRGIPESKNGCTKQLETPLAFKESHVVHDESSKADSCKTSVMGPVPYLNPSTINPNVISYHGHSEFVIEELVKRHNMVSFMSSSEASLDTLSEIITKSAEVGSVSSIWQAQACDSINKKMERTVGHDRWNQWRSSCLSYLLNKRTLNLISGVSLIFCCPKTQWVQALESLRASTINQNGDLLEMIELCLLGLVSRTWNRLIEQFTSCFYEVISVSKLYHDVHSLLQERSRFFDPAKQATNSKETDILEYLSSLLDSKHFQLWKLPPVLVAAGLPSWSALFHMYVREIEKQITEGSFTARYCSSCDHYGEEHIDCEIAERVWCVYVHHVRGQNHIH